MLFSVEQAFVGREEIRAPLKTPAWEVMLEQVEPVLVGTVPNRSAQGAGHGP